MAVPCRSSSYPCSAERLESRDQKRRGSDYQEAREKQQRPGLFELRAPRGITHPFPANDGSMSGSTIDLMLISGWKGKMPPIPLIITSPSACASDHLPIAMVITIGAKTSKRAKEIFLPSPHRRNSAAGDTAWKLYRDGLPRLASNLRA